MEQNDFKEFVHFLKDAVEPPPALSMSTFSHVRSELNPSFPWVLFKVFLLHLVGSTATLLFCPQYEISFGASQGIMPYLMDVHPAICFIACGLIWMIGGQLLTFLLLTLDEKRILGGHRWSFALAAIGLSLVTFECLGNLSLDLWLALWILGALSIVALCNVPIDRRLKQIRQLAFDKVA